MTDEDARRLVTDVIGPRTAIERLRKAMETHEKLPALVLLADALDLARRGLPRMAARSAAMAIHALRAQEIKG